jgi:hypothetical protein
MATPANRWRPSRKRRPALGRVVVKAGARLRVERSESPDDDETSATIAAVMAVASPRCSIALKQPALWKLVETAPSLDAFDGECCSP